MLTMTYTNTLRKTKEVITQKVIVGSEELGRALIAYWNRQSESFNRYHYEFISCNYTKEEDYFNLGCFSTESTYHVAEKYKSKELHQFHY